MENEQNYAIVIDADGYAVSLTAADGSDGGMALVLLENVSVPIVDEDGNPVLDENGLPQTETKEVPYGYTIHEGESLIKNDYQTALSMFKPRWTGEAWEETATAEELATASPEPVTAEPLPPSPVEVLSAKVDYLAMMAGVEL